MYFGPAPTPTANELRMRSGGHQPVQHPPMFTLQHDSGRQKVASFDERMAILEAESERLDRVIFDLELGGPPEDSWPDGKPVLRPPYEHLVDEAAAGQPGDGSVRFVPVAGIFQGGVLAMGRFRGLTLPAPNPAFSAIIEK